ncbi:MAG: 30S ribosomal protein S27ae [Candidatus Bathyarchaeota archaeon]|nr:MAG: 30S ribosomal protein S27ae [Candidatus Bathyarchaeota archaeon]
MKKSKGARKIHEYYEIKGDKIVRKLKKCPRCGSFMALHKQHRLRWTCGSCSYTDYSGFKKKSN